MDRLDNHRSLVTGAASGIGQATVLRLLEEGAAVVAATALVATLLPAGRRIAPPADPDAASARLKEPATVA